MKKTALLFSFFLLASISIQAQQGVTESNQNTSAAEVNEQANRKTCESLLDWVNQLKTTSREKAFLQKLSDYQMKLVSIKASKLADASTADELKMLENEIQLAVESENAKPANQSKEEKLYTKGFNLLQSGDHEGAEKTGRSLIKDYPQYSGGYYLMGLIASTLEAHGETVQYMSAALEMDPQLLSAYYFRAWAYASSALYDRALTDFEIIIRTSPENVEGYSGRAYVRWRKKEYKASNEDYLKCFEMDSSNAATLNNIGWNYFEMGEYENALPWINRSLAKNPEDGNTWDSRGETRFKLGDFTGAVEDMTKAISLAPEQGSSWLVRGKAYLELGEKEKGCEDLHKAVELGKREGKLVIEERCR